MKTKLAIIYFLIFSFFLVFAQSASPIIKKIQTISEMNSITITWELPKYLDDIVEFNLYRSTQSFTKPSQLNSENLISLLSKKTNSYKDTNLQNKEYYYAVIAKLNTGKLFDVLIPSENTTAFPTTPIVFDNKSISKKQETENLGLKDGSLRQTPLPYLRLIEQDVAAEHPFSNSENDVFKKQILNKNLKVKEFYVFEEDTNEQAIGDDFKLYTIITNYVNKNEFETAIIELTSLLNTKHDDNITARIYFYLGECSYFRNDFKSALNYFLLAEKVHPYIAKKWQQYSIEAFELP